jgi:hypothetical protein
VWNASGRQAASLGNRKKRNQPLFKRSVSCKTINITAQVFFQQNHFPMRSRRALREASHGCAEDKLLLHSWFSVLL